MEKTDFLARISTGLASHGLNGDTVKRYTDRVASLLDELPPEELTAILSGGIDVEAFVVDLLKDGEHEIRQEAKAESKPAAAKKAPAAQKKPVEKTAEPQRPAVKKVAAEQKSAEQKPREAKAPAEAPKPEPKRAEQKKPAEEKRPLDPDEMREKAPTERLPMSGRITEDGRLRTPGKITEKQDHTNFWILFWALSPLWILLFAAMTVLVAAMVLTFVVCILVLVAALIAVVVAGTALSLVGIIYGATQLFSDATFAVGLYELGQGIVIGGGTIFIGIILYNLAVRLNPWLIKQTVHMMGGFTRALKRLFYRVKGAMAR
ncbi:MAG: hypothetical protein IJN63_09750 [Clostridia bacterium]|nr:hypothetical protein [Clostridia bacterium]